MLISAKEIIINSYNLYKQNFQLFIRYMLLLFIPAAVTTVLMVFVTLSLTEESELGLGLYAALMFIVFIASVIISLWITIAFMRVLAAKYHKKEVKDIKTELQKSTHLILPLIGISILVGLIVLGGFILFIVPGIIFSIWYAFAVYSIVLDERKIKESLKYSKSLVMGRWWAVLWRLIAPAVIFGIVLYIVNYIINIGMIKLIDIMDPGAAGAALIIIIFGLLGNIFSLFMTPLTTAAPAILYLELKKTPLKESTAETK